MQHRVIIAIAIGLTSIMRASDLPREPDARAMDCAKLALRDEDRGICHVHNLRLRQRDLPLNAAIVLDAEERAYHDWAICHFPHAPLFAGASDEVTEWPPKRTTGKMWACRACRRARNEWALKHKGSKMADYIIAHEKA